VWKLVLYVVLPYGIMATLPAQAITDGLPPALWLLAVGVCAAFWLLTRQLWRLGLNRYGSASS
jgi:ABC-2 type transport system permease protein